MLWGLVFSHISSARAQTKKSVAVVFFGDAQIITASICCWNQLIKVLKADMIQCLKLQSIFTVMIWGAGAFFHYFHKPALKYVFMYKQQNAAIEQKWASACHWEHVTMIYESDSVTRHKWDQTGHLKIRNTIWKRKKWKKKEACPLSGPFHCITGVTSILWYSFAQDTPW